MTDLIVWGTYTRDQVVYVANDDYNFAASTTFSSSAYDTVQLHNPIMLNLKVPQTFLENYSVYVMCKNVLDDYNADPFNPGPGRMFYFGANAKL